LAVQDFVLPIKQAEERRRILEYWAGWVICASPEITNPCVETYEARQDWLGAARFPGATQL